MADVWSALRPGRVVRLTDALPPPPETGPAYVSCRLSTVPGVGETVEAILAQLDAVARRRYPDWLPGAEVIATASGAGAAAVRTLARQVAASGPQFGPFLADLAERSLRYRSTAGRGPVGAPPSPADRRLRFPAEVRAAGLARALAASARRPYVVLHVVVSTQLSETTERRLSAAAEWLASRGGFAVALATEPAVPVAPPTRPRDEPGRTAPAVERGSTSVGKPHPRSEAEQRLERALAGQPWAAGREWNALFRPEPLSPEFRIDLLWRAERCAVEIDGPEHHTAQRYEADRRRDAALQLAGFVVLRFTNKQVLSDVAAVVADIEKLVTSRRRTKG